MYDLPELNWAHYALSEALLIELSHASAFGAGDMPAHREQPDELLGFWRDPMLLLSQSCGYPVVTIMRGQFRLVATPCYGAEGCSGAWMRSAVLVRAGDPAVTLADLRGRAVAAINGYESNSGMNLLRAAIAPLAHDGVFLSGVVVTGAHVASMRAVADGSADVAAIDCVTLALLRRVRPASFEGLRILEWTQPTPGLPLVTSAGMSDAGVDALRAALDAVLRDPALQPARQALLLEGFELLDDAAYARVTEIEQEAIALGYPVLR